MFKDYIILKDWNYETGWCEIFFFDHELTNGDIERVEKAIQEVKDRLPGEYSNEDVEEAINEILPYVKSIIYSDTDEYHTVYF